MLAKTPVIQCSPCYSAVSALLKNPLPDHSNYSLPLPHPYLTPDQYLVSSGQILYQAAPLESNTSLLQHFTAESSQALRRNAVPCSPAVEGPKYGIIRSGIYCRITYPKSSKIHFGETLLCPFIVVYLPWEIMMYGLNESLLYAQLCASTSLLFAFYKLTEVV